MLPNFMTKFRVPSAGRAHGFADQYHWPHTFGQLSVQLRRAIARLQEAHAYGVQNVRIRLEPLDKQGERVTLFDTEGKPVQLMRVPDLPPEPSYRAE